MKLSVRREEVCQPINGTVEINLSPQGVGPIGGNDLARRLRSEMIIPRRHQNCFLQDD